MAAILKTFAGLNFYTRTCFIDYYHISFKKSHQTLRPRSCRVNQKFGHWISDYDVSLAVYNKLNVSVGFIRKSRTNFIDVRVSAINQ